MTVFGNVPKAFRTLGFLGGVFRRHGIAACLSAARRKVEFRRLNKSQPPGRLTLREGVSFRVIPEIANAFRSFIDMDPSMWREMDSFLLYSRGLRRLLDIGAHFGTFSLVFASQGGEALAVEPADELFRFLSEHAALNPELSIRPVRIALGERAGSLRMHLDGDHMVAGDAPPGVAMMEVPVTTVDELVRAHGMIPDAIKIDVEGHEVQALIGAQELLAQHAPLIFLEIHPKLIPAHGKSVDDLMHFLGERGYTLEFADGEVLDADAARKRLDGPVVRVVCRNVTAGRK